MKSLKSKKQTTVNVASYKNDIGSYKSAGAKYYGAEWFDWDELEISDRLYQTRVLDADIGHISVLAADIENVGLQTLPIVEWDPVKKSYRVLSGFHRLLAMHKNNNNPKSVQNKYPAIVLEFKDGIKRQNFLQQENNHRPAKSHGKAEAIQHIKIMQSMGYFDKHGKDEKAIKSEVYDILTKYYPKLKTSTKFLVFEEALIAKFKKIKTWTASETAIEAKRIYDKEVKSGDVEGDECIVSSDYNAARKVIMVKSTDRAKQILTGAATSPLRFKMLLHASRSVSDVKAFRKNTLNDLAVMNNMVISPKVSSIVEATFLPQVLSGDDKEVLEIKYNWSQKKKKFIHE